MLVVSISNEWHEMSIGKIKEYFSVNDEISDIPVLFDEISQETKICFGPTIPYHPELWTALAKLNPWERYALVTARSTSKADQYIFGKQKTYGDEPVASLLSEKELLSLPVLAAWDKFR